MNEDSFDFLETLELLDESQWLYKDPVTEVLLKGHLDSFPSQWLDALQDLTNNELNDLVVNKFIKSSWPIELVQFVKKCDKLNKLNKFIPVEIPSLPNHFKQGLSLKKQHEIFYLAKLTHEKCLETGINTIVDLGAGLGYICQILNYLYGYRILGFESNKKNQITAEERQKKLYPESLNDVKYICSTITDESSDDIESILDNFLNKKDEKICIIGLHSCGDLSVNACKLFSKLPRAKLLIIVSCCYHKIEFDNDSNNYKNFPISNTLSAAIKNYPNDVYKFLNRSFLRLACQEPADRWENMSADQHQEHAFCVLARAVLEFYTRQNGINLKKQVRKATRKSQCLDFDTYLADSLQRYSFNNVNQSTDSQLTNSIKKIWQDNKSKLNTAEIYTGLQLLLQAPCESLVLNDRRSWLIEQGYNSQIIPISNSKISPRCHAIVAIK